MAFTSLKSRINDLPLILCGPILRRVEPNSVTVWVALKEKKKVWLQVYEHKKDAPEDNLKDLTILLEGEDIPIRLGDNLHVLAVTATLPTGGSKLISDKIYYYNLFFTDADEPSAKIVEDTPNLKTKFHVAKIIDFTIHYDDELIDNPNHSTHKHLPSFALAPSNLDDLRIVHGSCRKPNAEGLDAMSAVDAMINADWVTPLDRPHYLFLTGDQIYADDVSPILLYFLMDAEEALIGSVEELPDIGKPRLTDSAGKNGNFLPETRKEKFENVAKYTSEDLENQLATIGEYFAMYLFVWSNVLWDGDFPDFETVYKGVSEKPGLSLLLSSRKYKKDLDSLTKFLVEIRSVRRALANVPTYMIFDDHDVTDDWNMTYEWCEKTMSNKLGRRLILNGLLSYTLFQGWGNTPEKFIEKDANGKKTNGRELLELVEKWFVSNSKRENISNTQNDVETSLQKFLGMPPSKSIFKKNNDVFVLNQNKDALEWHFSIFNEDRTFDVHFLDGRTNRGYPDPDKTEGKKQAHPEIISETSLEVQVSNQSKPPKNVSLIIAPTPIISIPAIELQELPFIPRYFGKLSLKGEKIFGWKFIKGSVYNFDFFDHWKNQSIASEKMLASLTKKMGIIETAVDGKKNSEARIIFLTGDVHFAAISRMRYQSNTLITGPSSEVENYNSLFVQLVSSSFKKQETATRILHQRGYKFGNISALALGGGVLIAKIKEGLAEIPIGGLNLFLFAVILLPLMLLHLSFILLDRLLQILDKTILKDFFDQKLIDPRHFLGWSDPEAKEQIKQLVFPETEDGSKPKPLKLEKPLILDKQILERAIEPKLKDPDWQYRIDYILAQNEVRKPALFPKEPLFAPEPGDRKEALRNYLGLAENHMAYAQKGGNGKEIVGVNNVAEVFFDWSGAEKFVRQESWWRLKGKDNKMLEPFPLSNFKVSLDFDKLEQPTS